MNSVVDILITSWIVLGQMAPYLLFGFLAAGVLSVLVSPEWVERHLGGSGLGAIIKSVILGVPLPLCSCGVIPVAASIRRHGAGRGPTIAFLISTPQTGVDSILATYALLGPVYAIFRPVAALITGIIGGLFVSLGSRNDPPPTAENAKCTEACCATQPGQSRWWRMIHYGFFTLPRDIAKALLVGIAVAGLISTFVQENALAPYLGGGLTAMLVMLAVGIPIYVCSTASIPIALGFMHMGASPGAALVFLIAGPATNAAAIAVVLKILGRRAVTIYFLTIAMGALLCGYALDWIYRNLTASGFSLGAHMHDDGPSMLGHLFAVLLLAVLINSLLPRKAAHAAASSSSSEAVEADTRTITLRITGMTCSHCVATVTRALYEAPGVKEVDVSLSDGRAVIRGTGLDATNLADTVRSLGYHVLES